MIVLRNYVLSLFVFTVAQHNGSKWCSVISEWMNIRKLNRLKNFAGSPSQPESISPSSMFAPHTYCLCFSWRLSPRVVFGALGSRGHIPGSPPSAAGSWARAGRPAYCWINMWLQKLWLIIDVFFKCCLSIKLTLLVTSQMPKVKMICSLVLGGYLLDMVLLMRHGADFSLTRVANSFTDILVFV